MEVSELCFLQLHLEWAFMQREVMLCIWDHQVGSMIIFKNVVELAKTMKLHMQFLRHSSSPSLSRNLCFVVVIKDGGLSEDDAVYPLCTVTNENLYIKNFM